MKNQYVGDINDYFKYALLRALASELERPVTVCWMLTHDDGSTDGGQTAYLDQPVVYRDLDPSVFDALRMAATAKVRSVARIEAARLIPAAQYFSRPLLDDAASRRAYFEELWRFTPPGALVFFDPDNGFEVASVPKGARGSSRYLYLDEFRETLARGHIAVVYQHFPRVQRDAFVKSTLRRVRAAAPASDTCAIFSSRVAFIVAGDRSAFDAVGRGLGVVSSRANGWLRTAAGIDLGSTAAPIST